jgi:hypothetical protein
MTVSYIITILSACDFFEEELKKFVLESENKRRGMEKGEENTFEKKF